MADDKILFDMEWSSEDPTVDGAAIYVPGLANYKNEDEPDEDGLIAGVVADADADGPCIAGGVIKLPLAGKKQAADNGGGNAGGAESSKTESCPGAGLMCGVYVVGASGTDAPEELPAISEGVLYLPLADNYETETTNAAGETETSSTVTPGLITGISELSDISAVSHIRDGVIYIKTGRLGGVSVVTAATTAHPGVVDNVLLLPLASSGSGVEAEGIISSVEVVDASSASAPILQDGTLRIPRANYNAETGTKVPGLLESVLISGVESAEARIENGRLILPRISAASVENVCNQKESSHAEPTIVSNTLYNPYANTVGGQGAVGLISAVAYGDSAVEPCINHGTIIIPRPSADLDDIKRRLKELEDNKCSCDTIMAQLSAAIDEALKHVQVEVQVDGTLEHNEIGKLKFNTSGTY